MTLHFLAEKSLAGVGILGFFNIRPDTTYWVCLIICNYSKRAVAKVHRPPAKPEWALRPILTAALSSNGTHKRKFSCRVREDGLSIANCVRVIIVRPVLLSYPSASRTRSSVLAKTS